ncbi:tyrosine-type recombinase/integrase [Desulfosarcina ovata]|uniref:tyrosine-type recombinase/integrase n=1 Tax=Desulfosarcina ovata TaxID=83564 RepID=UPI0012D2F0E9|nr:site-specific integrase [Desulfosarcina ovata]
MKPTDFAIRLTNFLGEYLPAQKNVSPNTIKACRDAFKLLLRYCRDRLAVYPEKLTLDRVNAPLVIEFLNYLEREVNCSVRTRNHRLSVMHAFYRYLQIEEPDRIAQGQQILFIPLKRCPRPTVNYLTTQQLAGILSKPNLATKWGRHYAVLLSILYDTGARIQELVDLSVRDVRLQSSCPNLFNRKRAKSTSGATYVWYGESVIVLRIWIDTFFPYIFKEMESIHVLCTITQYIVEHRLNRLETIDSPLFFNRRERTPFSLRCSLFVG